MSSETAKESKNISEIENQESPKEKSDEPNSSSIVNDTQDTQNIEEQQSIAKEDEEKMIIITENTTKINEETSIEEAADETPMKTADETSMEKSVNQENASSIQLTKSETKDKEIPHETQEQALEEIVNIDAEYTHKSTEKADTNIINIKDNNITDDKIPDTIAMDEQTSTPTTEEIIIVEDAQTIAKRMEIEKYESLKMEANQESDELRSHNYHLLKQAIEIINHQRSSHALSSISHNNDNNSSTIIDILGLGIELPLTNNSLESIDVQYTNLLQEVCILHDDYANKQQFYTNKITSLNQTVIESDNNAENIRDAYKQFKRKICQKAINLRTGKTIPNKWILQKEEEEEEIDHTIETFRLKNIHFNQQLKKFGQQLKNMDKLADGLHLIDFEQLKIENQTLNEKIEERNDELYKLRKKVTNTVQILAHIKEKLQYIIKVNDKKNENLVKLENSVNEKRDVLTVVKKKRDSLRNANIKLKQKQGFVGNDILVNDFQQRKLRLKEMQIKLENYQILHKKLSKTIKMGEDLRKSLKANKEQ